MMAEDNLRKAAVVALEYLKAMQHLGDLVDQKTLAADIERLESAIADR